MRNIIWSEDAIEDVSSTIDYLKRRWTKREINRFSQKIEAVLEQLSKDNVTFKLTDYRNTYKVPIVKQVTLFYQIQGNNIILVRFWNNYIDPKDFIIK